jgi:hypothetical protein
MKSFGQFNTEAMVHHIALKEGMSYDERQSLMEVLPLAIPAAGLLGKALATGYGMWSAYNAAKKLMPQQTQPRPAVDYGQGGGSFAASKDKPEPKPKPKVDRTPEGRGETAGSIKPKPEPPKQPDQPLAPRSSKSPGQKVNVPRGRSGESLTIKPSTRMSRLGARVGAVVRPTATLGGTAAALGGDADRTITPDKRKPYYGPGGDPSGSGKGQAQRAAVSSDAGDNKPKPEPEKPKPKPAVSSDTPPKPKPKPAAAAVPPSARPVEPVQSAGFNVRPSNLPPNIRNPVLRNSSNPYTKPR